MKTDPNDSVTGFFSPECGTSHGLSKREYFAGQIAATLAQEVHNHGVISEYSAKLLAQMSVRIADALIRELNEEK